MTLFHLSEKVAFPSPRFSNPDGLLAIGGDLSKERLLLAYRMGIFPWYSAGDPVLWWSPDPRLVLPLEAFHISKSLMKVIKKGVFRITFDKAFDRVISECAARREKDGPGTWIVPEMVAAYIGLHEAGVAHSVEAWQGDRLAGGLYGVSLGRCFFGESMFSQMSNASKVSLAALISYLKNRDFDFVDCQVTSDHLIRLGAMEVPRDTFLGMLETSLAGPNLFGKWGGAC